MLKLWQPGLIAQRPFSPVPSGFGTTAAVRHLRWTDKKYLVRRVATPCPC